MYRSLSVSILLVAVACTLDQPSGDQPSSDQPSSDQPSDTTGGAAGPVTAASGAATRSASAILSTHASGTGNPNRIPNELGRIMVLEYHLITDRDATYSRERNHFRQDLELLYKRGYRPVNMAQVLDRKLDLPRGLSPVVIVFDDASPEQFSYIENSGKLEIDPRSGLGIWLDFRRSHRDWDNKAVFCLLSGAAAGHNFFGDRGIQGQKTAWRFPKVKYLADNGFELCNHTLWHAQLSKYPDAFVQEQLARLVFSVDSAVPGYTLRSMALPQGLWPKNRALASKGSWKDSRSGRAIAYNYEVVFEVAGGPSRSPYDPAFNPLSTPRIQVIGNAIERTIERLEKRGNAYISDGNPATIARPPAATAPAASTTGAAVDR